MRIRHTFLLNLLLFAFASCTTTAPKPASPAPAEHGWTWHVMHPFGEKKPTPAPVAPAPTPAPVVTMEAPKSHGWGWKMLHPFAKSDASSEPRKTGVELSVKPDNASPSLAETRQINLTIQVINHKGSLINLVFPTSQRLEILTRTAEGKIIHTWSEDQPVTQEYTSVSINPGERIEYSATIPTRDMSAGRTYFINVAVVGQTGLSTAITVTPRS